MNSIYQPAEDSYLMSDYLEDLIPSLISENPDLKFLEIGAGSGINLKTVLNKGLRKKNIFATDIEEESVTHCRRLGFNCEKSDLFENAPSEKFNLIIFNPPYLPEDKKEPLSSRVKTTGGKKGNEIIKEFLIQSKKFLHKNGKILLITSSLSEEINFEEFGYSSEKVDNVNLFFEKIFLWKLSINNNELVFA